MALDDDAAENLHAELVAFDDLIVDGHGVTDAELLEILPEQRFFERVDLRQREHGAAHIARGCSAVKPRGRGRAVGVPQRSGFDPARATLALVASLVLVGRSSSHFTRIARMFGLELGVPFAFEPVYDITSTALGTFADNPTLRVPSLRTDSGTFFGSLNVSRELARRAGMEATVVWPEDLTEVAAANAQEIVLDTMAAEVTIITARLAKLPPGHALLTKQFARIEASVAWLERELPGVISRLPARSLSFLEVSAFCLCVHLPFREIRQIDDAPKLAAFARAFGERESARATEYRFDEAP
jgi:glutathione S-transferase